MTPIPTQIVRYCGKSMWPLLQEGDLVEIKRLPIGQVRRGDCVVFRSIAGDLTIHRVVAAGDRLRTRGDARPDNDNDEVFREFLIGKAVRRYRQGRAAPLTGGWPGLLAGRFYRLAGRFDPTRQARGGAAAKVLRRAASFLLGDLAKMGNIESVVLSGQAPVVVWYWRRWTVGRQNPLTGRWVIYWPWRVLFENPGP